MNKWYRSGFAKGILITFAHVLAIILAISILWVASFPDVAESVISGEKFENYPDSKAFSQQVWGDSTEILYSLSVKQMLETDGKFDGTKIVDLKEYVDDYQISNQNKNGIAYKLEDLDKWGEAINNGEVNTDGTGVWQDNPIIVCQKPDNTYEYYYYSELKALIENGDLSFIMGNNTENTSEEALRLLIEDSSYSGEQLGVNVIQDKEGSVKYVDCWSYDGYWIEEMYKPLDAENLLEIVNSNEEWNGRLSEVFDMISTAATRIYSDVSNYMRNDEEWTEGNTNLSYLYADKTAKQVYTNCAAYGAYDNLEKSLERIRESGKYVIVKPKLADFESNMEGISAASWTDEIKTAGAEKEDYVFAVNVDTKFPVQDDYYSQNQGFEKYTPRIRVLMILGSLSLIFLLGIIVWLTVVAGRSPRDEELHLHPFDRWKTEIAAALVIGVWFLFMYGLVSIWPVTYDTRMITDADGVVYYTVDTTMFYDLPEMILGGAVAVLTCGAFLIGYLSLVRRIKARTLWKNSLFLWLIRFVGQVLRNIHSVWKMVLAFIGFVVLHWCAVGSGSAFPVFVMFGVEILAFIYLVKNALGRQKIKTGIEKIAGGEVDYKIPLQGLYGEQLEIAERVNTIGEGLDAAVEASMKNERLKTDLITNVSHDIKTPLTSIINYIDLLKRENFSDPKIIGYLDILEAKAQRLKTLTEDVVEASKVSSGNISLEYMNINLVEMIQQTSGEFAEKFKKRNLKEILNLPEEEAVIRVDGRRMWRVLENIYNNATKYAMEGTRIYADLKTTPEKVIFSLKNISEQPLNIQADELTERFIRGDVSRSTEGSGLGLSIAKSLTEMQGGKFELYLDGDLFRVTITFPRMVK